MPVTRRLPELMSPVGGWPQLQAAIESGADAVYFGLQHFSARAKVGFDLEELPEVMETLHQRGVRGFVTCNTLVFDHELEAAAEAIQAMAAAGVDAVIVQDVGLVTLIRAMAPELEIHGSTQMSITSAQGAEFAAELGCSRVVLGRELSIDQIRQIAEQTSVELEVFVHGALCVSYSGQCFSSEAWGGRSANRGQCAQACRLSYDLLVDDQPRDLGAARYLLSPGDLCALDHLGELIEIGVACLKIEGRYKDEGYVALTTRSYRDALDLAWAGGSPELPAEQRRDLEQIYSRGLGDYFMGGTDHQRVVQARSPRHRGLRIGTVVEVRRRSVVVDAEHALHRGDGVVFDAADWRSPDEPEEGGRLYEVRPLGAGASAGAERVELEFGHGEIDFHRIRPGDWLWRTQDPQLIKRLRPLTDTEVPVRTRPLTFTVQARVGQPLRIEARLDDGTRAVYEGDEPLQPAGRRPFDEETAQAKLGRLGGTPYHLGGLELQREGDPFVPTSLLNQTRRELVDALFERCGQTQPLPCHSVLTPQRDHFRPAGLPLPAATDTSRPAQLHVLVRSNEQLAGALQAAADTPLASITLDYLELYGLRPAVERIREAGLRPRVASPRILKPAEQNVVRFLLSLECDILVRSSGLLYDLRTLPRHQDAQLVGDFSLNVANALTAFEYLRQDLSRLTPTYDLNAQQIEDLTEQVPGDRLEVIAYSHLPVFHTEHCLFCRFLSTGTDHTNCGHPCEKHQVAIRDAQGRAHPVMADVGCRNTVFGGQAQTDLAAVERWRARGIRDFRLEMVHQTAEQTQSVVTSMGQFLAGRLPRRQTQGLLDSSTPQGTTQGSLFVPAEFPQLVQLQP